MSISLVSDLETPVPSRGSQTSLELWLITSFSETGMLLVESSLLNQRQSIALRLIYHQFDRLQQSQADHPQLCQCIGGEGGTGKSVGSQVTCYGTSCLAGGDVTTATA